MQSPQHVAATAIQKITTADTTPTSLGRLGPASPVRLTFFELPSRGWGRVGAMDPRRAGQRSPDPRIVPSATSGRSRRPETIVGGARLMGSLHGLVGRGARLAGGP